MMKLDFWEEGGLVPELDWAGVAGVWWLGGGGGGGGGGAGRQGLRERIGGRSLVLERLPGGCVLGDYLVKDFDCFVERLAIVAIGIHQKSDYTIYEIYVSYFHVRIHHGLVHVRSFAKFGCPFCCSTRARGSAMVAGWRCVRSLSEEIR